LEAPAPNRTNAPPTLASIAPIPPDTCCGRHTNGRSWRRTSSLRFVDSYGSERCNAAADKCSSNAWLRDCVTL
jgi:hypothetical protein